MKYERTQIVVKHPVTGRDILFDSIMEAQFFQTLLERERKGQVSNIECHPEFVLQEPFIYFGKKVNGVVYTPDFLYFDNALGRLIAIEVKGIPTPDFELRLKWWKCLNRDIEIKVMAYSKGTGWMELGEYKKARRKIKQETFEARVKRQLEIEKEKRARKIAVLKARIVKLESKPRPNADDLARLERYRRELSDEEKL